MLVQGDRSIYLTPMAGGELQPGTVFAGHRIETVAGRGGMGVVYRATQLALDRTVALKVIAGGLLEDQTVRARFVRESKVAASIDHPNVIPIYYAGDENGIAYIAMRYVAGDDVRSLVRREGPLAPQRAAHITAQLGSALDAAHSAGLVHRDIKPANVLLGPEDHVYLTDFGLTKHALSIAGSTKPGHWVGTLDYVAPEQIRGERIDARADVYALGCLLYFTLTGEVPFKREGDEARLWAHLNDPPPKPSDHGAPEPFDVVVERALAKDPEERYPSAGDLGRAARAAAANEQPALRERLVAKGAAAPVESPTVSAAKPQPNVIAQPQDEAETNYLDRSNPGGKRRSALLGVALLAAVGVGIAAAVASGIGDPEPSATPTPTATKTATATPTTEPGELRVADEFTVGRRPNVVRVHEDNVFVGSFRQERLRIVSAETGKVRSYSPKIGLGVDDGAFGFGSLWLSVARANRLVRLDQRTGKPQGAPITLPFSPAAVETAKDAVWVAVVPGNDAPDQLLKIDPTTGEVLETVAFPWGIMSMTSSPSALWVAARRRARVQRVDLDTGEVEKTIRVGNHRSEDLVYRDGALWAAAPQDNVVYKITTATGDVIPISVGQQPRQLAIGKGVIYVTNYSSSDLYTIDAERSQVVGDPLRLSVNPFSLALDKDRDTLWVGSQPENTLSRVLTGRGG
ncbi:protein kinase [Solirubrobacter phytolaccae]|uniref:non-specific serine/threonine protein kinase n=1 Tax=Solirubrobacter phytolaccae TaxID=1404360 RepID=A0A9X3N690_9ACTN|nr:serine/threonine-protein kinase [Solirubrobacter phytolaccae]MDA0180389.1 protein kinase [Solirubrobacter phytolaccae]